jgi:hypothetical protein
MKMREVEEVEGVEGLWVGGCELGVVKRSFNLINQPQATQPSAGRFNLLNSIQLIIFAASSKKENVTTAPFRARDHQKRQAYRTASIGN